jgi:hypothetical protein
LTKKTGLLYDGDISSLVRKMKYSINNDISHIAVNARKEGMGKFLNDNYADKVQHVMLSVFE